MKKASSKLLWLFFLVLVLDQVSKVFVFLYLPKMSWQMPLYPYGGIGVFKDFWGMQFSIVHETNTGAAWGAFGDYGDYLLWLRSAVVVALAIYLIFVCRKPSLYLPLTLILAGALGNVIDGFLYSHVVDLFYFKFGSYSYPVFNVADSAIVIGVIWMLVESLWQKRR